MNDNKKLKLKINEFKTYSYNYRWKECIFILLKYSVFLNSLGVGNSPGKYSH